MRKGSVTLGNLGPTSYRRRDRPNTSRGAGFVGAHAHTSPAETLSVRPERKAALPPGSHNHVPAAFHIAAPGPWLRRLVQPLTPRAPALTASYPRARCLPPSRRRPAAVWRTQRSSVASCKYLICK